MKRSKELQKLINSHAIWLKEYKSNSSGTVRLRIGYLCRFCESSKLYNKTQIKGLIVSEIENHFISYCKSLNHSSRRSVQSTLRVFLQYCYQERITNRNLSKSIPTLRTYKLKTLPRAISELDAKKVISSIDRSTDAGRRDYAILQLLYHYGVRGCQVINLYLVDIDWHQNKIKFKALKHGKQVEMPLIEEVALAIIDYLTHSRPESSYPNIFLQTRNLYKPINSHSGISAIASYRIKKANLNLSHHLSAHAFRHCFAERMLRKGNSLKHIADCLGHSSIQTTTIYTKVDFLSLSSVPLELPEMEVV